jgi:lysozyme
VSHHQGRIDWPEVAQARIGFAYVKATEGGDFVDESFRSNWDGARAAGLLVGAYHFYRQCKSGKEQADNFLSALPRDGGQLPPVVDVEHMGPCPVGARVFDPATEIGVFLEEVEARAGCRPLLYVTSEFDAAYLSGQFEQEKFWVRSILVPPDFRRDHWVFWQYHNAGRRAGIAGPVDLNAFQGSAEDLQALVRTAGCFG